MAISSTSSRKKTKNNSSDDTIEVQEGIEMAETVAENGKLEEPTVSATERLSGVAVDDKRPYPIKFATQFDLLMRKTLKVYFRNRRATLTQVCIPYVFIVLIFFVEYTVKNGTRNDDQYFNAVSSFDAEKFNAIPECIVGDNQSKCYTFSYVCDDSNGGTDCAAVISGIRTNNANQRNGWTIPTSSVQQFSTEALMTADLYSNPNITQAAYVFRFDTTTNKNIYFGVQLNQTATYNRFDRVWPEEYILPPMVFAAEREILRQFGGWTDSTSFTYDGYNAYFPRPEIETVNIIGEIGTSLFFACTVFNTVVMLAQVVSEREEKLREGMRVMGMLSEAYWASWFVIGVIINYLTIINLIIAGMLFQFDYFLKNDFGVYFWVMFLFSSWCSTAVTFVLSHLVASARNSSLVGFAYFLVGFLMGVIVPLVYSNLLVNNIYTLFGDCLSGNQKWDSSGCIITYVRWVFALFPPTLYAKALADLGTDSDNVADVGIRFYSIDNNTEIFPIMDCIFWLFADGILWLFIAWYLDNAKTQRRGYLFFAEPTFWFSVTDTNPTNKGHWRSDQDVQATVKDTRWKGLLAGLLNLVIPFSGCIVADLGSSDNEYNVKARRKHKVLLIVSLVSIGIAVTPLVWILFGAPLLFVGFMYLWSFAYASIYLREVMWGPVSNFLNEFDLAWHRRLFPNCDAERFPVDRPYNLLKASIISLFIPFSGHLLLACVQGPLPRQYAKMRIAYVILGFLGLLLAVVSPPFLVSLPLWVLFGAPLLLRFSLEPPADYGKRKVPWTNIPFLSKAIPLSLPAAHLGSYPLAGIMNMFWFPCTGFLVLGMSMELSGKLGRLTKWCLILSVLGGPWFAPISILSGPIILYLSFFSPLRSTTRTENGKSAEPDEDVDEEMARVLSEAADSGDIIDLNNPNAPAIRLTKLRKVFRTLGPFGMQEFVAVKDITFDIPQNQLFCLLGPNGAGKSTTFNMLVGNFPPSSGDAIVMGHSIRKEMNTIQAFMGVCPQFDVLYKELTAPEHLRLFAALKGIPFAAVESEVDRLMGEVNLGYAKDLWSSAFSGGMKRRLSVAIALMGDPKIVYLDEPTTGMDPISRRQVWDVIERAKPGRSIVLTTHSMEEADTLGDKIAIVAKGKTRCFGTSLHLKAKFGTGYFFHLVLAKRAQKDLIKIVKGHVPNATHDIVSDEIVSFSVGRKDASKMPELFEDIEKHSQSLGIRDIQLSLATLEEVFLQIAERAEVENELFASDDENEETPFSKDNQVSPEPMSPETVKSEPGSPPMMRSPTQVMKDGPWGSAPTSPEIGNGINGMDDETMRASIDIEDAGARPKSVINNHVKKVRGQKCSICRQIYALFLKNFHYQRKLYLSNSCQILTPIAIIALLVGLQWLVIGLASSSTADNASVSDFDAGEHLYPGMLISLKTLSAEQATILYSGDTTFLTNIQPKTTSPVFQDRYHQKYRLVNPIDFEEWEGTIGYTTLAANNSYTWGPTFTSMSSKDDIDNQIYSDWVLNNNGNEYAAAYVFDTVDSSGNGNYKFTLMNNFTLGRGEDLAIHLALVTNSLANSKDNTLTITYWGTKDYPTISSDSTFDVASVLGPFFYFFIIHQTLPVILGSLVYEKEQRLREMMKQMGLKMSVYWIVNYSFMYFLYAVVTSALVISALCIDAVGGRTFNFFTTNDFVTYFFLLFFWGFTLVSFSFFISVFFSDLRTSTIAGYFYVIGGGIVQAVWISELRDKSSSDWSVVVSSMIPSLAVARGLDSLRGYVEFGGSGARASDIFTDDSKLAEIYAYLIVEAFIFFVLALYLDQTVVVGYGLRKKWYFCLVPSFWCSSCKKRKEPSIHATPPELLDEEEPDDVRVLREELNQSDPESYDLRVVNLRKRYDGRGGAPPVLAVQDFSLGVYPRECFGLLGPNGAGKSTAISMLSGLFKATSGNAWFGKMSIKRDIDEIHRLMGVCPQHDTLWANLTAREHLNFYGKLKGLYGRKLTKAVSGVLKEVGLYQVGNKKCGEFSGGMRRRLSVAISLIGDPPIIFMDEPSTGLDPASRRHLWDVILKRKATSSILLTTHSMEEADALCDRIGIFVDGALKCVGHSADLKRRFGSGYKFSVHTNAGNEQRITDFVKEVLPGSELLHSLAGSMAFLCPKEVVKFSEVFQLMQKEQERLGILDWGLSNTTLEEVFLEVSKFAKHARQ